MSEHSNELVNVHAMWTPQSISKVFGISMSTVRSWIRRGELPAWLRYSSRRRRGSVVVTGHDLNAYLVRRKVTADDKGNLVWPRRSAG